MDLKQLKTFIAVAETRSLSKAADRLKLGQPALSRHVRMLEDELGIALFLRHGRGMEPTQARREVVARTKGLVGQLDESVQAVIAATGTPGGQVALGIVPTAVSSLASRLYR